MDYTESMKPFTYAFLIATVYISKFENVIYMLQ